MKKVLLIVLAMGIGFWGCSESTSLIGPEKTEVQSSFLKVTDNSSSTLMKKVFNEAIIIGDDGGKVKIKLDDGSVKAKGDLKFKKGSFLNTETITVKLVGGEAALDFGPNGLDIVEGKPAILTVKLTGIDIEEGATADDFDFLFLEGTTMSPVKYKKIVVDKKGRWIKVVKAELTHFSRYGFTK